MVEKIDPAVVSDLELHHLGTLDECIAAADFDTLQKLSIQIDQALRQVGTLDEEAFRAARETTASGPMSHTSQDWMEHGTWLRQYKVDLQRRQTEIARRLSVL